MDIILKKGDLVDFYFWIVKVADIKDGWVIHVTHAISEDDINTKQIIPSEKVIKQFARRVVHSSVCVN